MTHQQLLDKIQSVWTMAAFKLENVTPYKALLAVAELHKPGTYEYFEKDICEHCTLDINYYILYPCPTINSIEKEFE